MFLGVRICGSGTYNFISGLLLSGSVVLSIVLSAECVVWIYICVVCLERIYVNNLLVFKNYMTQNNNWTSLKVLIKVLFFLMKTMPFLPIKSPLLSLNWHVCDHEKIIELEKKTVCKCIGPTLWLFLLKAFRAC